MMTTDMGEWESDGHEARRDHQRVEIRELLIDFVYRWYATGPLCTALLKWQPRQMIPAQFKCCLEKIVAEESGVTVNWEAQHPGPLTPEEIARIHGRIEQLFSLLGDSL
jgi:hypothetical protein